MRRELFLFYSDAIACSLSVYLSLIFTLRILYLADADCRLRQWGAQGQGGFGHLARCPQPAVPHRAGGSLARNDGDLGPEEVELFSDDAFGMFGALNGGITDSQLELDHSWDEMHRYYACIVGKYGVSEPPCAA
jgi:hypothetical protein